MRPAILLKLDTETSATEEVSVPLPRLPDLISAGDGHALKTVAAQNYGLITGNRERQGGLPLELSRRPPAQSGRNQASRPASADAGDLRPDRRSQRCGTVLTSAGNGVWAFRVQLRRDAETMLFLKEHNPAQTAATFRVPWTPKRVTIWKEPPRFNPCSGRAAHQPAYEMWPAHHAASNGRPNPEPRHLPLPEDAP